MTPYSIPASWTWTTLGELLEGIEAGKSFKCEERPPTDGEVGVLKVSAVTWGTYDENESKTCTDPGRVESRLFVKPGDLLFSRANTIDLVGNAVLVNSVTKQIMLSDKILRLRPRADVVAPAWLLYALRTPHGRSEIQRLATGNQESMRNIGQDRIRQIRLPVPPREEQGRILDELEKQLTRLNSGVNALERVGAHLKRYRTSVLKAACEGRSVPPQAEFARREKRDYEPADKLLDRILKERRARWDVDHLARMKATGKPPKDSSSSSQIVQKLWSYCNVLRDDGLSYGDYVEQLTVLLFLKMAHEQTQAPWNRPSPVPKGLDWPSLMSKDGDALETHYRHLLESLSKSKGTLGIIFRKAQNKIQDPAKLRRLIADLIEKEQWSSLDADVKGDAYEGLLEKNAQDTKSGAGQYFTPRPLIRAVVEVMCPGPGDTIVDPACGTGGFLLAAHDYIAEHHKLDKDQKKYLKLEALHGWEIVDSTARLCAMNLLLHGIGGDESPIVVDDALRSDPGKRFSMCLTNPPFGRKSSVTVINDEGEEEREALTVVRDDFWASTSNKQLNFVQHVKTLLEVNGRAAVVVPDNVLFEGGAGETVRRKLLHECNVHTLLRLPTGIFYAQGVKANVLFFDKKPGREKPWTEKLWVYDLRTNKHFTLKTNTLKREDLDEFVDRFKPENRHQRKATWSEKNPDGRWRPYTCEELLQRDKVSLDVFWLKDESLEDSANLPDPGVIAGEIVDDLRAALEQFEAIQADLARGHSSASPNSRQTKRG